MSAHVIGIDEVGMGCLAGPVTVAAVVMPKDWKHELVRDSKTLKSMKSKRAADGAVRQGALTFCILSGTNEDIDREGLRKVHARLVEQAALYCLEHFPHALIVQDGDVPTVIGGKPQNMVWLPRADALVPAVSAASCVAKLYRDEFMWEQAKNYPGYNFQRNVGYGTPDHLEGLRKLGPCLLHRMSFKKVRK